jgi:hypothetical protein
MTFDAQAEAALARRSFPEFCALMDSRFADPPPFMRMMMDDFADVESGKCRFLALSLPPVLVRFIEREERYSGRYRLVSSPHPA